MKLSEHFSLDEFTQSQYAVRHKIDNTPNDFLLTKLKATAKKLEQVRELLGQPITISSGYRCEKLNIAIGGSRTSAHVRGEAIDFTCPNFGTPYEICVAIMASGIEFDQLIFEGTWVHIAFDSSPRNQVLTAKFTKQGTKYLNGLLRG